MTTTKKNNTKELTNPCPTFVLKFSLSKSNDPTKANIQHETTNIPKTF